MHQMNVTNNYLMDSIMDFENLAGSEIEEAAVPLFRFVSELGVSTLLLPVTEEGDGFNFEVITSDDESVDVIPLFSDEDRFMDYYGEDSDLILYTNDIRFFIEIIEENDLDGLVINPSFEELFMERELLEELPLAPIFEDENESEGYGPEKLREIAENVSNDSLVNFLKSDHNDFEALLLELQDATLLNLVFDEDGLNHGDEIIRVGDDGFTLPAADDDENTLGVLYT